MNRIITKLDNLFEDTVISGKITDYFKKIKCETWFLISDYCLDDPNKPNNVITFSIIPYSIDTKILKEMINKLAPKDIKEVKKINEEFIKFLLDTPILNISFILTKKMTLLNQRKNEIQNDLRKLKKNLLKKENQSEFVSKLSKVIEDLNKNNFNLKLFKRICVLSFLSGYLTYKILLNSKSKNFVWLSDRDDMLSSNSGIINILYGSNLDGIIENKKYHLDGKIKLAFGEPEAKADMWYDELIRIPDYIAGTLADWDMKNNLVNKPKFVEMLETYFKKSQKNIILKLNLENNRANDSIINIGKN